MKPVSLGIDYFYLLFKISLYFFNKVWLLWPILTATLETQLKCMCLFWKKNSHSNTVYGCKIFLLEQVIGQCKWKRDVGFFFIHRTVRFWEGCLSSCSLPSLELMTGIAYSPKEVETLIQEKGKLVSRKHDCISMIISWVKTEYKSAFSQEKQLKSIGRHSRWFIATTHAICCNCKGNFLNGVIC